jgi:hypothetical protein
MAIKYTDISHYKNLQNLPKMGFLVRKCTISSGSPDFLLEIDSKKPTAASAM